MDMIRAVLERDVPHTDIEGIVKKMNDLTSIASHADHLCGLARNLQLERRAREIDFLRDEKAPGTVVAELSKARCCDEEGLFLYCSSIIKTIKSNLDTYRSILSKYKEEIHNNLAK